MTYDDHMYCGDLRSPGTCGKHAHDCWCLPLRDNPDADVCLTPDAHE